MPWSPLRLLAFLSLVTTLTACKIEVRVPEGGEVVTQSGSFRCGSGETCTIDVYDTDFDETFVARADSGQVFRRWRKQPSHFCGDREDPCRLATTGFVGNADLLAVLRSDQAFYLAPVFEPPGRFSVSGTVTTAGVSRVDSDVNDPFADYLLNDFFSDAQAIPNPASVGGYANLLGEGPSGPSADFGDPEDIYSVALLKGQEINLHIASPETGDLDLYLIDEQGEIVDYSVETGLREHLTVARSGRYYISVFVHSGASNYTLSVGQPVAGSVGQPVAGQAQTAGYNARAEFIPEEVLVQYRAARGLAPASVAGSRVQREALANVAVHSAGRPLAAAQAASAGLVGRFSSAKLERKWRALTTIKSLAKRKDIAFAEPNFIYRPFAVTPGDPQFDLQWHYSQINLPGAWEITRGSPDVTVAVLDSGVLGSHPDLRGQLLAGFDFVSDRAAAGDGDGIDADPEDPGEGSAFQPAGFHGTHVAGTIAARTDNGVGVAGAGWRTRVLPVRVIGNDGATIYDLIQGFRYAAGLSNDSGQLPAAPADVINMSLGGAGRSQAFQDAIQVARDAGLIVVAAAGNDNSSLPLYPAAYAGVLSVGAVGQDSARAPYSNFGATLDLMGPGGDVSADVDGDGSADGVLSTRGATGAAVSYDYGLMEGTSMATPHVSAVLALMKAVRPVLTPADVDGLLETGKLTQDLGQPGYDNIYGFGVIDARKAVLAARDFQLPGANNAPALNVTPRSLVLSGGEQTINLTNSGSGSLQVGSVTSSVNWLTVAPEQTDSDGLGSYRVALRQASVSAGIHEGVIVVRSTAGTSRVPVLASIAPEGDNASAGTLYLILTDTDGAWVDELSLYPEDGRYRYKFNGIREGSYFLVVGSDMNNDVYICDAGEACGAYPTLSRPRLLILDRDRDEVNFNVSFGTLLYNQAQDADGANDGDSANESRVPVRRTIRAADSPPPQGLRRRE